jgi:hypothetical protein
MTHQTTNDSLSFPGSALEEIGNAVKDIVIRHPDGLSEYQCLRLLHERGCAWYDLPFADSGTMFNAHFGLFHVLYTLRDAFLRERSGCLEINALSIRLAPYCNAGSAAPVHYDRLREYYLDLANLRETTADDVDEMIAAFWTRLEHREQRADALAELGLQDPVDEKTIKRRYRELAMKHHPDRGGSKEKLQVINGAMQRLGQV